MWAYRQELHFERERGVRRDPGAALRSVGERRRDDQLALFPDFHAGDALLPSFDDLSLAEDEVERFVAVARAVELLAVGQGAHVMHAHLVACFRGGPLAALDRRHRDFFVGGRRGPRGGGGGGG